jgi:hypothetical protein
MLISKLQSDTFWRLWSQACRAQGWSDKAAQERERKAFLVRCGFSSLTLVDRLDGFTKVKKELQILISPDLDAAREAEDQTINRARNSRWVIKHEILLCLALYEADVNGYLQTVLEGQSRWNTSGNDPQRPARLQDFEDGVLKRVLMTLNGRLHAKRREAGHSIHDMKIAAGVKCNCARICAKSHPIVPPMPAPAEAVPAVASEDPDWRV